MNKISFNDKVKEINRLNRCGIECCDSEFFHLKVIQILDKQDKLSKLNIEGWNKYSKKSYSRSNRPNINYENLVYLCFDMFQDFCKSNRYSLRLRWFERDLSESKYMVSDVVFIFNYCEEYLRKLSGENVISRLDRNWLTSDLEQYFNEQLRMIALNTSEIPSKVVVKRNRKEEQTNQCIIKPINRSCVVEEYNTSIMSKKTIEKVSKYGMIDYDKKEFIFMVTEMLKKNTNISIISLNTWNRYSKYKFGKFARENMELLEVLIYSSIDKFADIFSKRYISLSSRWFGDGRDIRGMLYQDITFIYALSEDYLRSKKGVTRLSPTNTTLISDMEFYLKENMNNIYSELTGEETKTTSSVKSIQYRSKARSSSRVTKDSTVKLNKSIKIENKGKDCKSKVVNTSKRMTKEQDKELDDILSTIDDFIF